MRRLTKNEKLLIEREKHQMLEKMRAQRNQYINEFNSLISLKDKNKKNLDKLDFQDPIEMKNIISFLKGQSINKVQKLQSLKLQLVDAQKQNLSVAQLDKLQTTLTKSNFYKTSKRSMSVCLNQVDIKNSTFFDRSYLHQNREIKENNIIKSQLDQLVYYEQQFKQEEQIQKQLNNEVRILIKKINHHKFEQLQYTQLNKLAGKDEDKNNRIHFFMKQQQLVSQNRTNQVYF